MSTPRLAFRLPGAWEQFSPDESKKLETHVRTYVESRLGTSDEHAQLRILLRRQLQAGLKAANEAEAESMFICSEIAPGIPVPVAMTVYSPNDLKMSPSVGTSPERVMDVFKRGRAESLKETEDDWAEFAIPRARILRTIREETTPIIPEIEDVTTPNLLVDYWYTVPDTKKIIVVGFSSPLADVRNVMIEFFDSIVRASRFVAVGSDQ